MLRCLYTIWLPLVSQPSARSTARLSARPAPTLQSYLLFNRDPVDR